MLAQTWRDFELIVIDDGSTDGTPDLLLKYEADSRFRRLLLPHRGVSAARNAGVAATGSPWIAFLDSDDEWLPEKLDRQLRWAFANPEFEILQTHEFWIRHGRRVNPPKTHAKFGGDLFAASLDRCMVTPSSVMIRRDLFAKLGGFDELLPACEDFDLWLRVTCRYPVGLVDEYLLRRYGGHEDQLSNTVPVLDRFRVQSTMKLIDSGVLSHVQRRLASASIVRRAEILAQGCRKRGNFGEEKKYLEAIEKYGRQ